MFYCKIIEVASNRKTAGLSKSLITVNRSLDLYQYLQHPDYDIFMSEEVLLQGIKQGIEYLRYSEEIDWKKNQQAVAEDVFVEETTIILDVSTAHNKYIDLYRKSIFPGTKIAVINAHGGINKKGQWCYVSNKGKYFPIEKLISKIENSYGVILLIACNPLNVEKIVTSSKVLVLFVDDSFSLELVEFLMKDNLCFGEGEAVHFLLQERRTVITEETIEAELNYLERLIKQGYKKEEILKALSAWRKPCLNCNP